MAIIIEAPNEIYSRENNSNVKLFLAGGIQNCPDWQSYVVGELREIENLTIYNPRRKNFPMKDPAAAEQQITWEYNHLHDASMVIFWFSRGSLNPIVLYELGMWGNSTDRPIIIGIDPEYERKVDVIMQTELARPDVQILYSIQEVIDEVKNIFAKIINLDE
jgi:hypothetical protein